MAEEMKWEGNSKVRKKCYFFHWQSCRSNLSVNTVLDTKELTISVRIRIVTPQAMFETVVNQTPWLFRHFPRNSILNGLKEKGCDKSGVTEDLLIQVCREVTPEKYMEKTMKIMEEMKTKY
jgi:hypothetical protein